MNRVWLAVVGLVLLTAVVITGCSTQAPVTAQSPSELQVNVSGQQEGIWINGTGKVTAIPDTATLSLGVESQETSVAAAQERAAEAMNSIIGVLKDKGIEDRDIQTQHFNIQRVTRWDNDRQQETVVGFRVTNIVNVKIRNVDEAGPVIDAVAAAAGDLVRINGISFSVEDPTAYQDEARTKAVADARAKAEQIAALAGVQLGKPIYITESTYQPGHIFRQVYAEAAPMPAMDTSISAGELDVIANVQIVYEIKD